MVFKNTNSHGDRCPRCHECKLTPWSELDSDERFVAERLPMSAGYSAVERRRHLFCKKCWYETNDGSMTA